jgi:hypothetical protein
MIKIINIKKVLVMRKIIKKIKYFQIICKGDHKRLIDGSKEGISENHQRSVKDKNKE